MRWRAILAIVALVGLTVAATLAVERALRRGREGPFADYARLRRQTIEAHLAQTIGPYVLLLGDSHAERLNPAATLCGFPVVNAGVGGARAGDALALLRRVKIPRPPVWTVLSVGTNDIGRKLEPASPAGRERFTAAARSLLAEIGTRGGDAIVLAVPPVGSAATGDFDPAAVGAYSDILGSLCTGPRCRFVDPSGPLRDGAGGLARAGALPDGIHIGDNAAFLARLAFEACPQ